MTAPNHDLQAPALLGCSTVMFSGDLATRLTAMKTAGFTHTELTCSDLFGSLRGAEHALDLVAASGLQVSAYSIVRDYEGCPESQIALRTQIAGQLMDQTLLVGCDLLIVCCNTASDCASDPARLRDDLRRLADLAASKGVRLAYEALCWGTVTPDCLSAAALVESVDRPNFGLLIDSSHIGALGDSFDVIRRLDGGRVFHVQVADLPSTRLPLPDLSRYYRMLPGDGVLDLSGFVERVRDIGYRGVYSLEVLSDRYVAMPAGPAAGRAMAAMTTLMHSVGHVDAKAHDR